MVTMKQFLPMSRAINLEIWQKNYQHRKWLILKQVKKVMKMKPFWPKSKASWTEPKEYKNLL